MAISFVQQTTGWSTPPVSLTLTNTPVNGNYIILGCNTGSTSAITSISQTGVTWTKAVSYSSGQGAAIDVEVWIGAVGSGAGKTITVNSSSTGTVACNASEWSGIDGTIDSGGAKLDASSGSPFTLPFNTTTNANDLLYVLVRNSTAALSTSGGSGGWTLLNSAGTNNTVSRIAYAYQIVSATGSYSAGGSGNGTTYDAITIPFKAASSSFAGSKTQTATARIQTSPTSTQSAKARIQSAVTKDQTTTSRIQNTVTATQSALARIQNAVTNTISAIARIQISGNKAQPATARLQGTPTKTQTAISRISKSFTKLQTAISRIAKLESATQPATARVENSVSAIQSATAHIIVAGNVTKTQTATARISKTLTLDQQSVSRIQASRTLTQPAVSRLEASRSATQPAKARIRNLSSGVLTKNFDARSRALTFDPNKGRFVQA